MNPRPAVYKTAALPLSYVGVCAIFGAAGLVPVSAFGLVIRMTHPIGGHVRAAASRTIERDDERRTATLACWALDLCDLQNASAVLALANSDAKNLEIALGARVRAPDVPLVVRMENASFALATTKLFSRDARPRSLRA